MRCDFWYFIIDDLNEFDENVSNMILKNAIDTIDIIDAIDVIKFMNVIEKLIENVIKQTIYVFVIKINKIDNIVDIDINLNVIDENDVIDELIFFFFFWNDV